MLRTASSTGLAWYLCNKLLHNFPNKQASQVGVRVSWAGNSAQGQGEGEPRVHTAHHTTRANAQEHTCGRTLGMRMAVQELRHLIDPFVDDVWWFSDPLTRGEVEAAAQEGRLLDEPLVIRRLDETPGEVRRRHVERVAYFLVKGWTCHLLLDGLKLVDGHHRLAAAILRGDEWVEVDVLARRSISPNTGPKGA